MDSRSGTWPRRRLSCPPRRTMAWARRSPSSRRSRVGRGIALGVVIVVAAAASGLVFSPPAPRLQAATSTPSPSAHDYGPVPAGVPLIYGAEPANELWITAAGWSGHARGSLQLPGPLT